MEQGRKFRLPFYGSMIVGRGDDGGGGEDTLTGRIYETQSRRISTCMPRYSAWCLIMNKQGQIPSGPIQGCPGVVGT